MPVLTVPAAGWMLLGENPRTAGTSSKLPAPEAARLVPSQKVAPLLTCWFVKQYKQESSVFMQTVAVILMRFW